LLCLGIDTTGAECSAAIVDSAKIHAYGSETIHRGHAEKLAPMVDQLFKTTGISARQLDKISVCCGPGSFTGLRVGLSFAKGLALPWEIPVVGISGLEVWARSADPSASKTVVSCADVRRGEMFWQIWDKGIAKAAPRLTSEDEFKKAQSTGMEGVGSGADIPHPFISPAIVAWLGLNRSPRDYPAEPLYHRPPDAKLPGGRTLKGTK